MCGGIAAYSRRDVQTLLDAAEEQGSLTPSEIVAILTERELPVKYDTDSSVGPASSPDDRRVPNSEVAEKLGVGNLLAGKIVTN